MVALAAQAQCAARSTIAQMPELLASYCSTLLPCSIEAAATLSWDRLWCKPSPQLQQQWHLLPRPCGHLAFSMPRKMLIVVESMQLAKPHMIWHQPPPPQPLRSQIMWHQHLLPQQSQGQPPPPQPLRSQLMWHQQHRLPQQSQGLQLVLNRPTGM